jgi:hypothetical protein
VSGIGNRPSGRYEVCRDNRADRDPRFGWYVFDNETGKCVRFFSSQASAYSLLRRIQENPRVAARSLEPETPGTRSPERDLVADGLEDAARVMRARGQRDKADQLEERAQQVRWQVTA